MYRLSANRTAILISFAGLVPAAFAQDSTGWRKFGTSSSDQAYSVNQSVPVESAQAQPAGRAPQYPTQQQYPAQQYPPQQYAVPSSVTLPSGTFLVVRVNDKLSSDKNQPGDFFTVTLTRPLIANGLVIAQPGQNIAGRVSEALNADRGKGTSRLGLELTEITLIDGQQIPIRTQLMEYHRGTSNGRDAGVVLGTTAAGAAIGAAAGGGFGAGVGAIGGAIAGAIGVVATRARATEIHPESLLTFRIIDTVNIATDRSGGAFQPVQQQGYSRAQNGPTPNYPNQNYPNQNYGNQNYGDQNYGSSQPVQRAVAPPAPYSYYGYGGYYDPFYYPYYPYGGYYYGYGPGFGATFVFRGGGGGFRGGSFRGGGGRRR